MGNVDFVGAGRILIIFVVLGMMLLLIQTGVLVNQEFGRLSDITEMLNNLYAVNVWLTRLLLGLVIILLIINILGKWQNKKEEESKGLTGV